MASRLSMYKSNQRLFSGKLNSANNISDITRVDISQGSKQYSGYTNTSNQPQTPQQQYQQYQQKQQQRQQQGLQQTRSNTLQQLNNKNKISNTQSSKLASSQKEKSPAEVHGTSELMNSKSNQFQRSATRPIISTNLNDKSIKINNKESSDSLTRRNNYGGSDIKIEPMEITNSKNINENRSPMEDTKNQFNQIISTPYEINSKKTDRIETEDILSPKISHNQDNIEEKNTKNVIQENESDVSLDESMYDNRSHMQNKAYKYLMKNSPDKYIDYLLKQENLSCIQYRDDDQEDRDVQPQPVKIEENVKKETKNRHIKINKVEKEKPKSLSDDEGNKTIKKPDSLDNFKKKLQEKFKNKDKPNEPGVKNKSTDKNRTVENTMEKFKKKLKDKFKNKSPPKEPVNLNIIPKNEVHEFKEIRDLPNSPSLDKFKQRIQDKFKNKERPVEPDALINKVFKEELIGVERGNTKKEIKLSDLASKSKDRKAKLQNENKPEDTKSFDRLKNKLLGKYNEKVNSTPNRSITKEQDKQKENSAIQDIRQYPGSYSRPSERRGVPDRPYGFGNYDLISDMPPLAMSPIKTNSRIFGALDYPSQASPISDYEYRYRQMVGPPLPSEVAFNQEMQQLMQNDVRKTNSFAKRTVSRHGSNIESMQDNMRVLERMVQEQKQIINAAKSPSGLQMNYRNQSPGDIIRRPSRSNTFSRNP